MNNAVPSDIEALRTALVAVEARAEEAEAKASSAEAIIAALKLMVEKLRRVSFASIQDERACWRLRRAT